MKITIGEFAKHYNSLKFEGINDKMCVREHIVCADGFAFSCQHSYHHYCNLYEITSSKYDYEYRKTSNLDINENTTFEIMFKLCSQRATKKLHKYKCKSESLYVNVPHDVIIDLINYHGGLKKRWLEKIKQIFKISA